MSTKPKILYKPEQPDPKAEFAHLRDKIRIDKYNLDEECVIQPELYQEISEAHALACADRDTAKESLAVTDSIEADCIRRQWDKEGIRFSEVKVGDAVQRSDAHKEAYRDWSYKVKRAAYLQSLLASADQRSKMLRELGQLYSAGYWDKVTSGKGKTSSDNARATAGREGMRQARMRGDD